MMLVLACYTPAAFLRRKAGLESVPKLSTHVYPVAPASFANGIGGAEQGIFQRVLLV